MPLPTPNLDDRRFQDLVDEAKRGLQQRCPEWTDHNVSDPGVTLIETFASMVEQLLYRLNRVPESHYLKFLDLIGVRLFAPTTAGCDVTFWLSAPVEEPVVVPKGAQVATSHSEVEDPVVFSVREELRILPCGFERLATAEADGAPVFEYTDELLAGKSPACFASPPAPGNAMYFGLSNAVPGCAVLLRMECAVDGVGVDPRDPPLVWEAWNGDRWERCEVEKDTTGGLNKAGDVVLHLPATHTASVLARQRAGWLRCRITVPARDQPFYQASPTIGSVTAATIGGTVAAEHAETVRDETVGVSSGAPGQRFPLAHSPVVADDQALIVEVAGQDGWEEWREVMSFAQSGPADRHVMIDRTAGEIMFGPAIRQPDGSLRLYGAVPAKSAAIRVPEYRTGGGKRGNVSKGMLRVQRDPVPFVSSVTNRRPADGGVDGESVADAARRGPLLLRTLDRAVTAEDYEQLARGAAPEAARVRCIPVDESSDAVRVLVVPSVPGKGELDFGALRLNPAMRKRIEDCLSERRCIGARVSVEPPYYQGVTVVAQVRAQRRTSHEGLRARAIQALYEYFSPVSGGPDGDGWPFGRPVQAGEVFAVLQRLPGVDLVHEVLLFGSDPAARERGEPVQRINLPPNAVVFSFGHQIRVQGE
ncbi:MAG TPA: putative baseplate assembly protein [Amycolatopsis sp.]|uniref:putative baseplate assembly protein n=1 Tax=Amycolatopsis sp. TaxID=37632 RepID=UPI002B46A382|nr:putative baseplate assembly protein [Amycolatopsis sp.]HKS44913.1 putative baseplate assembly protein [Amycolatopsis sp.]